MSSFKKGFIINFLWSFIGRIGNLLIVLFTNILLARLLSPYEFGQMGILMFFIALSLVLTESGLTGALVRKVDATEEDFSTVFVFNLIISSVLFIIIFFSSGYVAQFYNIPELEKLLIVLSSVLLINAFRFTQNAKLLKELKFKKITIYTFISVLISSGAGVLLAYFGFGIWALVWMQIINSSVLTLFYWKFEGSIKAFVFKKESFKSLYKFGVNTTLASTINSVFDNIYSLIFGKYFSIQITGYYFQAKKLQEIPIGVIRNSTLGVVFSTLSKLQNDKRQFDEFYNKIIIFFTVIVGLICLLIYYYSEQIVLLLYGKVWLNSVFFLKILIIASFFYMQEMFNRILFKVFDRTDKILYLEIIKKVIQTISVFIGLIYMKIEIFIYGFLITSIISYFINYFHSRLVYNSFSWSEIFLVIKTLISGIITYILLEIINYKLALSNYNLFYYLPFLIFSYFTLLKIFNVLNVIREFNIIVKKLIKR